MSPLGGAWAVRRLCAGNHGCLDLSEASRVALITLLTPAMLALSIGRWLDGEQVAAGTAVGRATILAGLGMFHWGEAIRGMLVGRAPGIGRGE